MDAVFYAPKPGAVCQAAAETAAAGPGEVPRREPQGKTHMPGPVPDAHRAGYENAGLGPTPAGARSQTNATGSRPGG